MSAQPAMAGFFMILISGAYELNLMLLNSKKIEREKHSIESSLNKSRQKILRLEESLQKFQSDSSSLNTDKAIKDYHSKLTDLSAKFGDLSAFEKINHSEIKALGENIIYSKNGKMNEVVEFAKKIAPTTATVLLLGESGTGKELLAKAIHNLSKRNKNKFVAVNCGAIPQTLLESELFGHEEGAYTGAHKLSKGYFETADKGTIFLDEITETNELFQVKLLRVLQSGELNRVGGSENIKVDVRIIAASNKNIESLVSEKKFREDLYYRLNVIKISIPPLRIRKPDIPGLVVHFLNKESAGQIKVSDSVIEAFMSYGWPGNIRQLENIIKRAAILAAVDKNQLIRINHLPPEIISSMKNKIDLERQVLEKLRQKEFSYNSISETATEMGGLHRGTVSEYLRGICFREFCENQFDIRQTALSVSDSENKEVLDRVQAKIEEYLNNLNKKIDSTIPFEALLNNLRENFKKMPNRYLKYLEEIAAHLYNSDDILFNFRKQ